MKTKFHVTQIKYTLFLLAIAVGSLWSQPSNAYLNNIMVPSPEVASLGKYTDIPVSYYTGIPNISIPLHTVLEGPLSLPISLSYHAGGVRVAEAASWVGLGWSLQAGGMVSRSVQGKKDEDATAGWYYHGDGIPLETDVCAFYNHYSTGDYDSEPDIFSFAFPGGSGKFYFSNDAIPVPVLVPMQDLKILPKFTANSAMTDHLNGFDIVTPDGTRYEFGGTSAIEITASDNGNYPDIPSSWFLSRIVSYDGSFVIKYSYNDEYFMQKYSPSRQAGSSLPEYMTSHVKGKRLATITTSLDTITFVSGTSNREDIDLHPTFSNPPKPLSSIIVKNGGFTKRYDLVQDYWEDNSTWASSAGTKTENKRLRLLSLTEKSGDGVTIINPAYSFDYFTKNGSPNYLPKTLSRAVDHWGFYNGKDNNNQYPTSINVGYSENSCLNGNDCTYEPRWVNGTSDRETDEAP